MFKQNKKYECILIFNLEYILEATFFSLKISRCSVSLIIIYFDMKRMLFKFSYYILYFIDRIEKKSKLACL